MPRVVFMAITSVNNTLAVNVANHTGLFPISAYIIPDMGISYALPIEKPGETLFHLADSDSTEKITEYMRSNSENPLLKAEIYDPELGDWYHISFQVINFFKEHEINFNNLLEFTKRNIPLKWAEKIAECYPNLKGEGLFRVLVHLSFLTKNPAISVSDEKCFIATGTKLSKALVLYPKFDPPDMTLIARLSKTYRVCMQFFNPQEPLCPQVNDFKDTVPYVIIHTPQDPNLFKVVSLGKNTMSCFSNLPAGSNIFLSINSAGMGRQTAYNFANHLANHMPDELPLGLKIIAPEGEFTDIRPVSPVYQHIKHKRFTVHTDARPPLQINFYNDDGLVPTYVLHLKNTPENCLTPNSFLFHLCAQKMRYVFYKGLFHEHLKKTEDPFEFDARFVARFTYKNPVNNDYYEMREPGNSLFKLGFSPNNFEKIARSGTYFGFFYQHLSQRVIEMRISGPEAFNLNDTQRIAEKGLTQNDITFGKWTPQKHFSYIMKEIYQQKQKIAKRICPKGILERPLYRNAKGRKNIIYSDKDITVPFQLEKYDVESKKWEPINMRIFLEEVLSPTPSAQTH